MLTDILSKIADRKASMLLVGPPGVGKTTLLRDIVRLLADKFNIGSRVMVVDTSNEVGGDGDTPHPAIGNARRLQVQSRPNQHKELVEAVQNHNPRILVVDEIGNAAEAEALQGVGHRGACIIGTAHGNTLHDVLKNPELSLLLGGLAEATIGDRAALMNAGRKTKTERKGPPVFQILVEVLGFNKLHIHLDTIASVDAILSGKVPQTQHRVLRDGKMVASLEGGPTRPPYPNQNIARRPPAANPAPMTFNPAFAPAWQRGSLAEQGHGRVLRPVPPSEPYPGPSRRHATADMFGGVASQSVVRAQADFDTLEFLTGSLPKIVNRRR